MKKFNKRTYHSLKAVINDSAAIFKQRLEIKSLMRGVLIENAFRERIMLAVTEVNGCRYCQYAHAKMALNAGLSQSEIKNLSQGAFHNCPPAEVLALLYAQHWAENDAVPDPQTRQQVIDVYGESKVEGMELAMRMIRMGNLMGNTWDYFLYRVSFGRWGNEV